jgi:TolA-binding protein
LRDKAAARECRGWLSVADSYIEANNKDKAREFLRKIVQKYPDTTWALKAKVRLRNLD